MSDNVKKRYLSFTELATDPLYGYHLIEDGKNGQPTYYNANTGLWFPASKIQNKDRLSEIKYGQKQAPVIQNPVPELPLVSKYMSSLISNMLRPLTKELAWNKLLEKAKGTFSYFPVVGEIIDVYDAGTELLKGNYGAAAAGLGLMLLPEWAEKGVKKGGKFVKKLVQSSDNLLKLGIPKAIRGIDRLMYNTMYKPFQKYDLYKFKKELLNRGLLNNLQLKQLSKVKIEEGPFGHSSNTIYLPRKYRSKLDNGFSLGHEVGHLVQTSKILDDFKSSSNYSDNYSYHPIKDNETILIDGKEFPRKITEQYSDYIGTLGGETQLETVLQIPSDFYFVNRVISNPKLFPQTIKLYGKLNLFRGDANPDFKLFGKYLNRGSESHVYNHPINENIVYKVNTNTDYIGDINEFILKYVNPRNETPMLLPLRVVGITSEGYPIYIQPKVFETLELSEFEKLIPEINTTLNKFGFSRNIGSTYLSNGRLKIGDFNAGNIGRDPEGFYKIY